MINVCFPFAFSATSKFLNLVNGSLFIFGPNMFFFAKRWGALRFSTYSIALGPPRKVLADSTVATWRPDGWEDVGKWSMVFAGDAFNTCLGPSENVSTVQFVSLNRVAQWMLGVWKLWEFKKSTYLLVFVFVGDVFQRILRKSPSKTHHLGNT